MSEWAWPWTRRAERRAVHEQETGRLRQELAGDLAQLRSNRRSLEAAIKQLEATQVERGEDD